MRKRTGMHKRREVFSGLTTRQLRWSNMRQEGLWFEGGDSQAEAWTTYPCAVVLVSMHLSRCDGT